MMQDPSSTGSEAEQMRNAEYWDGRYNSTEDPAHKEWHLSYRELEAYLEATIYPRWPQGVMPKIAQLGSGLSTVPLEMLARGYTDQTCLEFSTAVIEQMAPREPALRWLPCDLRAMPQIASDSFDLAFDKGTFYALCAWGPTHLLKSIPDSIREDTRAYSREVLRILKPGGVLCLICIHGPRYVNHLLTEVEGTNWQQVHPPVPLTPPGWVQTLAYCFQKPVPEETASGPAPADGPTASAPETATQP